MRRGAGGVLAAAALAAACASAPRQGPPQPVVIAHPVAAPAAKPTAPTTPPPVIPADANVLVEVSEAVGSPEDDFGSYTKIYIDNQPAGETQVAAKSQPKKWGARVPAGNHLFRFEKWNLPSAGDWTMLDFQWQPPERFIRVEDGQRLAIALKFYEDGTKNDLQISRQPAR